VVWRAGGHCQADGLDAGDEQRVYWYSCVQWIVESVRLENIKLASQLKIFVFLEIIF
jgi:hypothetical protein